MLFLERQPRWKGNYYKFGEFDRKTDGGFILSRMTCETVSRVINVDLDALALLKQQCSEILATMIITVFSIGAMLMTIIFGTCDDFRANRV